MKKLLFIVPAFLFSVLGFSQGIVFEHGTWKEVLEKAQQTNKPIFVEVYTASSDSCKQMAELIFPLETVGKAYNENFICYQVDAEKGDGAEMAKMYEVQSYPTYLFFNADGSIFCKSSKAMSARNFISVSRKALAIMYESRPMDVLERAYAAKKDDPAFLTGYIRQRSNRGLSNAFIFDKYLTLLPEEERTSETVADLYIKEGKFLRINSVAYENLQKNKAKFDEALGSVDFLAFTAIRNTIDDAALSKDEQLLATAMLAYDQLSKKELVLSKDELYMMYYKKTGETDQYLEYTTNYCNNNLMKISNDTIDQRDQRNLQVVEQMIHSGVISMKDTALLAKMKENAAHTERNKISNNLNSLSREVFDMTSNKKMLKNALKWSERSIELSPDNAQLLETYASLLYKLGKNKDAIAKEEEALNKIAKEDVARYRVEETLVKMKAGEKTWKN